MFFALPFFTASWKSNPVLDQNVGMIITSIILLVIATIMFLYYRSKRIRSR